MFPLTHSDYAITLAIDETDAEINNPPLSPEEEAAFAETMAGWLEVPPAERRPLINELAKQIPPSETVDASYNILSNVRSTRFNEMEYSVPREAGADCVREVLATIAEREIDVVMPLEYRYVKGDDLWLSMDEGGDRAAISVHRLAQFDYQPLFEAVEPIFWKYGGRPHWGKLHTLGHKELTVLYPRFEDFCALRAELDPTALRRPRIGFAADRDKVGVPSCDIVICAAERKRILETETDRVLVGPTLRCRINQAHSCPGCRDCSHRAYSG